RLRERRRVEPRADAADEPLQQVYGREPPLRVGVVRRRRPDEQRPHVRVAERVAAQRLALELELVPAHAQPRPAGWRRRVAVRLRRVRRRKLEMRTTKTRNTTSGIAPATTRNVEPAITPSASTRPPQTTAVIQTGSHARSTPRTALSLSRR